MISRRNVLVVVVAVAGAVTGALLMTGGDDERRQATAATPRAPAPSVVITLRRTHAAPRGATGTATLTPQANGTRVKVVARGVEPISKRRAYEVWLYNSRTDVASIGATYAPHGRLKGTGLLPANYADYADYRYIDVSLEKLDRHREHSGRSVLRGRIP